MNITYKMCIRDRDKTPREMKDTILALLDEWKEKQPPELGKPDKKKDMEK